MSGLGRHLTVDRSGVAFGQFPFPGFDVGEPFGFTGVDPETFLGFHGGVGFA
jgi:hypothetical protein